MIVPRLLQMFFFCNEMTFIGKIINKVAAAGVE